MRQQYAVGVPFICLSPKAQQNLMAIIDCRSFLFETAFGVLDLPVVRKDEMLWFPWFTLTGKEGEAETYASLIYALCQIAQGPDNLVECLCAIQEGFGDLLLFYVEMAFTWKRHLAAKRLLLSNFQQAYRMVHADL